MTTNLQDEFDSTTGIDSEAFDEALLLSEAEESGDYSKVKTDTSVDEDSSDTSESDDTLDDIEEEAVNAEKETLTQEEEAKPEDTSGTDTAVAPDSGDAGTADTHKDDTNAGSQIDYEALYRETQQKLRSFEGRIQKEKEERARAEMQKQLLAQSKLTTPSAEVEEELSKELKELYEDFPELKVFEKKISSKIDKVLSSVEDKITSVVTPLYESEHEKTRHSHETAIMSAHPDCAEILESGKFDAWASTLTPFQRVAVETVKASGTADEVIDMFNSFKQSNFYSGSNTFKPKTETVNSVPAAAKPKSSASALSPDLVEQLRAALSVPASGSTPKLNTKRIDKDDFDSAFEEALRTYKD